MLGLELLFLPSHSPNHNVIERLWKFANAKALRGEQHRDFLLVDQTVDHGSDDAVEMKSPMTLNFQTFDKTSFMVAVPQDPGA